MPAVHVEACFITNPREEELLRSGDFRGDVATAIATGVERFFLEGPAEDASTTGEVTTGA